MSLMDAKVGDTVVVRLGTRWSGDGGPCEARIAKVGRKYLYVEGSGVNSRAQFSRETGREVSDFGYRAQVYLPEEWAASVRRGKVVQRIEREHKIRHQDYTFPQSVEALEAILKILDDDAKARGK